MSEGDDRIETFMRWSKEQGILINGVRPAVLSKKRTGVVALRALSVSSPSSGMHLFAILASY